MVPSFLWEEGRGQVDRNFSSTVSCRRRGWEFGERSFMIAPSFALEDGVGVCGQKRNYCSVFTVERGCRGIGSGILLLLNLLWNFTIVSRYLDYHIEGIKQWAAGS